MTIRQAPFALRVVRRRVGDAAILYRRRLTQKHREQLDRIGSISPLAFASGGSLLRAGVRQIAGPQATLSSGPYHPLDPDWGARIACYALVSAGLRNPDRLRRSSGHLEQADGTEASWWLSLMMQPSGKRAVRALRILVEAVK